jgi:threonine/homoserine/homoserine lactone efflux protein
VLGWSVAWPPGPVNAEILRRVFLPRSSGGGFWNAWQVGLGAGTGDFLWALAVMTGAGTLLNTPRIRFVLAMVSLALLLFLAGMFALRAWRCAHSPSQDGGVVSVQPEHPRGKKSGAYFLGFIMALTSPWTLAFWLAVVGGQQTVTRDNSFGNSLAFAGAVVCGALIWMLVFAVALKQGRRFFAQPAWQAATQAITSLLMLFFAARLLFSLS